MIFRFRFYTGPVIVKRVAVRLRSVGIAAEAGTEDVYGEIEAEDRSSAADKINAAAGYRATSDADIWSKR